MSSVVQGFTKSLAMTVLSEIGDKTFFAAAVMTILSALVGWAAPNLLEQIRGFKSIGCWSNLRTLNMCVSDLHVNLQISQKWAHHITTLLFFGFGLWSLKDAIFEDGEAEELAEVEAKLDEDWKAKGGASKESNKVDDDLKKYKRPLFSQFFSPIFLKAFSITFFGEWGDKSQLATIGLAADENPFGVVLGGIMGQALCTTAAVVGGKSLASQISEKIVALSGGILFIVFGIQSLLTPVGY
ncbi:GDT1-like protein 4 [Senna tora]|uniref:GDT1 family protein n=1 Tax=Senna tora TaxID=362788 RepID=A0A834W479_9FABA|nr:GDT1-like protein 4 [Senna tora]